MLPDPQIASRGIATRALRAQGIHDKCKDSVLLHLGRLISSSWRRRHKVVLLGTGNPS
jgi:hypothetical protein